MHTKPIIHLSRRADSLLLPEARAILAIVLVSYLSAGIRLIFG